MTARIGLAAIDVCRPAPFHALEKPKLSNFISMLTKLGGDKKTAANNRD
jgi:putative membrane protein